MRKNGNKIGRDFRTQPVAATWLTVLATASGVALPVAVPDAAADSSRVEEQPMKERAVTGTGGFILAQFQLPNPSAAQDTQSAAKDTPPATVDLQPAQGERRPRLLHGVLEYQYALGSESDITYRRNPDTNRRVRDNALIVAPQINGYITYRPNAKVEMTLELILEREFDAQVQKVLLLPNGDTRLAQRRRTSFLVDQGFVTLKHAPFELLFGRKNFEDERHWLYDTSLDTVLARYRQGVFQAEASVSRKDKWDLDLARNVARGRVNNYMLYMTYRGIEDLKLNGYVVKNDDRAKVEGRPVIFGASVMGNPSNNFSYWAEHAYVRGQDELRRRLSGYAGDVGGTYRFLDTPFRPNVTLGAAFGSGDKNSNDNRNHAFRQTGLQSNESRNAGVAKFKTYGEVLDPELSNLAIYTAAIGFQPAPGITADVVYHRYRLHKLAEEIRNSPITAELNQVDVLQSKDVGQALDVVLGFRQLFGVRRLGLDLRMGVLFPGAAYLRNDGDDVKPIYRKGEKSYAMVAKIWYLF